MIISKTPFRISLIGGGTDFPSYYKRFPGIVIGGTIDKYCYVSARYLPNVFNYKHRIVWSKNEVVTNNNQIIHPTVKAIFNYMRVLFMNQKNLFQLILKAWKKFGIMKEMQCFSVHTM